MKRLIVLVCVAAVLGASPGIDTAPGQNYHDPAYLCGGYQALNPSTAVAGGVWVVRGDGSATSVALPHYNHYGFCMDADNKHIVVATRGNINTSINMGAQYGIYRFDPNTLTYQTLHGPDTMHCYSLYNLHVNQDGDYLFNTQVRRWTGSTNVFDYQVMKLAYNGTLSTLLTTSQLGRNAYLYGAIGTNIDNGKNLVCDLISGTGYRYPVLELAPDGTVNTWSTGGTYGWYGYYQAPQNHLTGDIEGPYASNVYQIKPGTTARTTLFTLRAGSAISNYHYNYQFDLQTAPVQRWVGTPYSTTGGNKQWIGYVDRSTGALTSIHVTGTGARYAYYYDFDFYRGNHIQTLKIASNKWMLLLSCPRSPGYAYVVGASFSGIRPGISVAGGRRININVDNLLVATVLNRLPGVWNSGPGVLNASGEARGMLDLSFLKVPPGGFGIPLWIAMVVLDHKAPGGIKYIPDTYVIRI